MKNNSINPKTVRVSNISFVSKAVDYIYTVQEKIGHHKNINDIVNRVLISTLIPVLMERR